MANVPDFDGAEIDCEDLERGFHRTLEGGNQMANVAVWSHPGALMIDARIPYRHPNRTADATAPWAAFGGRSTTWVTAPNGSMIKAICFPTMIIRVSAD